MRDTFYNRFPNIKYQTAVCGVAGREKGIDKIMEKLGKIAFEQPYMSEVIPKGYLYLEVRVVGDPLCRRSSLLFMLGSSESPEKPYAYSACFSEEV